MPAIPTVLQCMLLLYAATCVGNMYYFMHARMALRPGAQACYVASIAALGSLPPVEMTTRAATLTVMSETRSTVESENG